MGKSSASALLLFSSAFMEDERGKKHRRLLLSFNRISLTAEATSSRSSGLGSGENNILETSFLWKWTGLGLTESGELYGELSAESKSRRRLGVRHLSPGVVGVIGDGSGRGDGEGCG